MRQVCVAKAEYRCSLASHTQDSPKKFSAGGLAILLVMTQPPGAERSFLGILGPLLLLLFASFSSSVLLPWFPRNRDDSPSLLLPS